MTSVRPGSELQFPKEVFFNCVRSKLIREDHVKIDLAFAAILTLNHDGCAKLDVGKERDFSCFRSHLGVDERFKLIR